MVQLLLGVDMLQCFMIVIYIKILIGNNDACTTNWSYCHNLNAVALCHLVSIVVLIFEELDSTPLDDRMSPKKNNICSVNNYCK